MSSSIRRLGHSTGQGKRSAALAKSWPRNNISHHGARAAPLLPETLGWGGSGMPAGASHATRAPPPRAVQTLVPPTVQAQPQGDDVTTFKFDYGLVARVTKSDDNLLVDIDAGHDRPVVMHWAVDGWTSPADEILPSGTNRVDAKAVQTQFRNRKIQIKIPKAVCPKRIVFVLKELEPEAWINDGSVDFSIHLRQPDFTEVVDRIIASETQYTNWSLKDRMQLVMEVLDAADQAGPSGMGFIYSYLQLSQQRQLDWYRRSNYQPKDLAHTSYALAQRVSDKARSAKDPWVRLLARLCMSGLPRGGGNGDQIRHGILDIMRRYNIKEGHRQGHDEPFLEQWHQKLHQNTSPDDITICEAYLAFLHSGNHDDYWRVLWDNGRLTKERLEKFNQPITAWPQHLPHLIGPFQHYLWILKTTHSGADLDVCAEFAKGGLDGDLQWTVFDILQHRNEWWVPGKIVDTRQRLMNVFKTPGSSRDVLLLDIALEGWFRVCVERMDPRALSGDDLLEVAGIVLKGGLISADSEELRQCLSQWDRLRTAPRWTKTWALQAMATVQRTQLSLANFMDTLCASVQPAAETLGNACKLDQRYIVNFGEEAVRSQPLFVLSPLLQALEPILRNVAGMSAWQIVSQTESAVGEVVALGSLAEVQGKEYASPVLLLADKLGGNEDIPTGVQAVITRSTTDVLSHVAIRARSQGVLLATCHDDGDWNLLKSQAGSKASYAVDVSGAVHSTLLSAEAAAMLLGAGKAGAGAAPGASGAPLKLQRPSTTSAWALPEAQFTASLVGRKSLNLATLRKNMPAGLKAPASVTLPLGTFERVLGMQENAAVAGKVSKLLASLRQWKPDGSGVGVPAELAELRSLVSEGLVAPPALVKEVASLAASSGLVADAAILCADPSAGRPGASWPALWSAISRVWASKWNDRAWLSRRARSVPEEDLFMAVLLQEVVPARYAFVLHTANPITNAPGELFGEVVAGMGEALVGSHPGRALSFCTTADGTALHSLPSKRAALWAPPAGTIIARSDANGEDLEGFAGAGLYDSVPVAPLEEHPFDYSSEALMWDDGFRSQLLGKLTQAGHAVKAALGAGEQDIEGVWTQQGGDSNGEGQIYIVQARAQVASA